MGMIDVYFGFFFFFWFGFGLVWDFLLSMIGKGAQDQVMQGHTLNYGFISPSSMLDKSLKLH